MPSTAPRAAHLGTLRIRPFHPGEEHELRQVFMSSVHTLAYPFYSQEQLNAWAPAAFARDSWRERIAAMNPFVAVVRGRIAAYAGVLESGCIDHFFVRGEFAGVGVGSALMRHLQRAAAERGLACLHADVSLAAEAFFLRSGFTVQQRQTVVVRGVRLDNVRMGKQLARPRAGAVQPRSRSAQAAPSELQANGLARADTTTRGNAGRAPMRRATER